MVDILIFLGILVIVVVVVWWLLSQLTLPEPIGRIVTIAMVVVVAVVLIILLLQLGGHGPGLKLR